jgi:hypothetical protein
MTSQQYEELCRFFISRELKIDISKVVSRTIANPRREPQPHVCDRQPYRHQIDLYWETTDGLARYVNIANAKWRARMKVCQQEVLLLQKVREKVGAHKAFMITNSGFSSQALQVAADEGIGLLIVRPTFDKQGLHPTRRRVILEEIQELAKQTTSIYAYEVVHKTCGMISPVSQAWLKPSLADRLAANAQGWQNGTLANAPPSAPPLPSGTASQGCLPGSAAAPSPNFGGYATRQGGGPGFRAK